MKCAIIISALLLSSCSHRTPAIPIIEFAPSKTSESRPTMVRPVQQISVDLPIPDIAVDLNWLDLEGFYPPRAERIGSNETAFPDLLPATRIRFPSMEIARSPDQRNLLFHDGARRDTQIHHWLMLLNPKKEEPTAVYGTSRTFDVMWAPNSRHFAITTYSGENSSNVSVLEIGGKRQPVDVRDILRAHFPSHVWDAPMFVKAYRWTTKSDLVVRCLGRSSVPPFDIFGCEGLVALSDDSLTVSFSRGFMLWSIEGDRYRLPANRLP